MSNIEPYLKYNDSKTSWLGDLPDNWKLYRLKYIFEITKRIIGELGHDVLSITQKGIKIKDTESGAGQLSMDYSKYQQVDKGDFAMNHMDLLTGFVDISKYDGVVSPDYRVFKLIHTESDSNYLLYILQLCYTQKIFFGHGKGVSMLGRWRLPAENFKNFIIPIPPKEEQIKIAAFLDYKLAKIDRFIRKKKQLIKLLNEQKTAIINKAVTKGLNPKAQMKPSGIEWLGDIPEHWEISKIKWLSPVKRGASPRPIDNPIYFDDEGEYSWVRIADVTASERYLQKTTQTLSELGSSLSVIQEPGDMFLSIAGSVGKPIITKIKCCIHDGFVWFPLLKINKEFMYYIFAGGRAYLGLGKMGTQLNLNTDTVGGITIPLPPNNEINDIVQFLDDELSSIGKIIITIEKEITLTQEYRTALIAEAVTGKIDVREFAIPEEKEGETYEDLEEEINIAAEDEAEYEIMEEN